MGEQFDYVYEQMNKSFSYVEGMMGVICDKIKNDPTNSENIEILEGLGEIALKILYSQREFTDVYADGEMKDYYMSDAVSQTRSSKYR